MMVSILILVYGTLSHCFCRRFFDRVDALCFTGLAGDLGRLFVWN